MVMLKEMSQDTQEQYLRQLDILKPEVCNESVFIIGAGATGSFTALSLAKMGIKDIRVFDDDKIELHNFPNQLYPMNALGQNKAEALRDMVEYFTGTKITAIPCKYTEQPLKGIVVSALDTMAGRKEIFQNCVNEGKTKLLVDPRTGPEVFRVLTVNMESQKEREAYLGTLHSDEEAEEAPCTARTIIYSVLSVSAIVAKQIKCFLMNQEYKRSITFDLKQDFILSR